MATIRNENKENRLPDIQKHNAMAAQQKRTALGQRSNINVAAKTKQPLGISNTNNAILKPSEKILKKIENNSNNLENSSVNDENDECLKENRKNLVNPIVPCAQFEAFKVYEDQAYEERMARIEEKLKSRIKHTGLIQVYKGTAEDRFYTKTEVAELERKKRAEDEAKGIFHPRKELADVLPVPIPMSIEKFYGENISKAEDVLLRGNKSTKDIFFEMEEYRSDIYKYLREHELHHRPKPGYMKKQPDVTSNMRTILVDWLVEVAEEYKLHNETLFLAVNFIDRFLSYMSVVRAKLQLVGTAAMFLASKYEEIYPPDITEFVYITDDTYNKRQVIRMEHLILKVLGFDLSIPTPLTFVTAAMFLASKYEEIYPPDITEFVYITDDTYNKRQVIRMEHLILKVLGFDLSIPTPLTFVTAICVSNKLNEKTMYYAMYQCELALLNGDAYLEFLPSAIAASSIAIARHTLQEEKEEAIWQEQLVATTGYELAQLRQPIEFLLQMLSIAPTYPQHAIQDKYKSQKYMHVSTLKVNDKPIDF
ncbi:unnamed protein product [Phaedon cochleariae]|uniref:Cyclin A n=1 Tax=Phaedon cochleariae TaxID=80249 RepID=A0A9N9X0L0_PHACE|nr:unnamed protein product [Phaedon cochleariae]